MDFFLFTTVSSAIQLHRDSPNCATPFVRPTIHWTQKRNLHGISQPVHWRYGLEWTYGQYRSCLHDKFQSAAHRADCHWPTDEKYAVLYPRRCWG